MHSLLRLLGAGLCALVPGLAAAVSTVTSLSLGTSANPADCANYASVTWSFTYTVPPTTEFSLVTTTNGNIGGFTQPSTLTGGSFSGPFTAPIQILQPPDTLIGTYGSIGDFPATANTAEFFMLYNCTTRQVVYQCSGNGGRCPRSVNAALALISPPVPVDTRELLVATLVMLGAAGGVAARRRALPSNRR